MRLIKYVFILLAIDNCCLYGSFEMGHFLLNFYQESKNFASNMRRMRVMRKMLGRPFICTFDDELCTVQQCFIGDIILNGAASDLQLSSSLVVSSKGPIHYVININSKI